VGGGGGGIEPALHVRQSGRRKRSSRQSVSLFTGLECTQRSPTREEDRQTQVGVREWFTTEYLVRIGLRGQVSRRERLVTCRHAADSFQLIER